MRELKHHLPFSLVVSLLAGVLVAVVYNFWVIPSESFFEVLHPAHVLVSAAATSAIYYKYVRKPKFSYQLSSGSEASLRIQGKLKFLNSAAQRAPALKILICGAGMSILIGVVGAIIIGTLSDVLLPWVGGNLFFLETGLHLPIIEEPLLILGVGFIGALFGVYVGVFRLTHSLHVLFSVFASLFYLLAFSGVMSVWVVLGISLIVFLVVYVPCCISDIVFPILFIKRPCKDCGYYHD